MRLRVAAALVGLALYLVVVPFVFRESRYLLGVLTTASVLSLISLGVWLTFAIGRINIGQAAFALVGGYTTAILSVKLGVSFWLCLPASGLAAALVGAVIGWPILRLKGVYFAMITLTLSEAARLAALNGGTITQGATGILNIPLPGEVTFAGVVLVPAFRALNVHLAFYYLAAILLVLGLFTVTRIASCRLGWIFRSLRQDEALAASIGVNVAKYRVLAFALGCFFGGIVAVDHVTFQANEGEVLSIIGQNGAGKSTLFKLITSFLPRTAGRVIFQCEDITGLSAHLVALKGVVRTFQETTIFKEMSALENVGMAHHLRGQATSGGLVANTRLPLP